MDTQLYNMQKYLQLVGQYPLSDREGYSKWCFQLYSEKCKSCNTIPETWNLFVYLEAASRRWENESGCYTDFQCLCAAFFSVVVVCWLRFGFVFCFLGGFSVAVFFFFLAQYFEIEHTLFWRCWYEFTTAVGALHIIPGSLLWGYLVQK